MDYPTGFIGPRIPTKSVGLGRLDARSMLEVLEQVKIENFFELLEALRIPRELRETDLLEETAELRYAHEMIYRRISNYGISANSFKGKSEQFIKRHMVYGAKYFKNISMLWPKKAYVWHSLFGHLQRENRRLDSLCIIGYTWSETDLRKWIHLPRALAVTPIGVKATFLSLKYCNFGRARVSELPLTFASVQHLSFKSCQRIEKNLFESMIRDGHVQSLKIDKDTTIYLTQDLVRYLQRLSILKFTQSSYLDRVLWSQFTQLTKLNLSAKLDFVHECLNALPNTRILEELQLTINDIFFDVTIFQSISRMANLTKLIIIWDRVIWHDNLPRSILENNSRLTKLRLKNFEITWETIIKIINIGHIQQIDIEEMEINLQGRIVEDAISSITRAMETNPNVNIKFRPEWAFHFKRPGEQEFIKVRFPKIGHVL